MVVLAKLNTLVKQWIIDISLSKVSRNSRILFDDQLQDEYKKCMYGTAVYEATYIFIILCRTCPSQLQT